MEILSFLFPKKCLECGLAGRYICASCIKKVPPGGWNKEDVYSTWKYEGVIRKAIISLKYKQATQITKELMHHVLEELDKKKRMFTKNTILLPIPLYWYKQNTRGFNQSEMIGRAVAEHFSCKFIPTLLIRKKHAKAQVELKGAARRENIRGVFEFNSTYQLDVNRKCSLVIIDDVWTTGSTLKEAIKVLNDQGFKNVWGLTIAN